MINYKFCIIVHKMNKKKIYIVTYFVCIVRKINFMEYLCRFVLYSFYFYLMWRILSLAIT